LKRGWLFLSADYRLLLPSTSYDQLEDMRALANFLASGALASSLPSDVSLDLSSIFVMGASAGAHTALQYCLVAQHKPKALLNTFGMVDLLGSHYLGPRSVPSPTPASAVDPFIRGKPSAGSALLPPKLECADGRHVIVWHTRQEGNKFDYMLGQPGISAQLAKLPTWEARAAALNESQRAIIPLLRAKELPPTFLIHGDNDTVVPLSDSEVTAKLLSEAGVRNELVVFKDGDHGFCSKDGVPWKAAGGDEIYAMAVSFLESLL
jgi:acetyl esterase/lipase